MNNHKYNIGLFSLLVRHNCKLKIKKETFCSQVTKEELYSFKIKLLTVESSFDNLNKILFGS